ncbi:hypothetical protein [Gallibacterium anatis]|uniref:hypothetical protein n=1 Tax=Gallibacterium anatis TaxID=750 RepID=UPI00254C2EF2|nr:hypothetical protein [Gallibacterium anatis]WIM83071.1 hypothetical protein QP019_05330 [Gallibacterium anatis]
MKDKYEWNSAVQENDEGFEQYICNVDDNVTLSLHKSSFNNEYMGNIYSKYGSFNQGFIHSEFSKAKQLMQKQWEEIEKVGEKNKLKEIADNLSNYSNKKKEKVNNKSELIVCAAFLMRFYIDELNQTNYVDIPVPVIRYSLSYGRHLLELIKANNNLSKVGKGFITNKGRFVDSKEALEIAKANNQLDTVSVTSQTSCPQKCFIKIINIRLGIDYE